MSANHVSLGAFLRARRDRMSPAGAGLSASTGHRRVPGLRHDELASLAGISPDYYRRLEQDRHAHVSDGVIDALADALRLSEMERKHLRQLAARSSKAANTATSAAQRPHPTLLRVMDCLAHVPVFVTGRRTEILARNALLPAVLDSPMTPGTLYTRWVFQDPAARARITPWDDCAHASLSHLRAELGRHPDDPELAGLIDELLATDADAARWWDQCMREFPSHKVIQHPVLGTLVFNRDTVMLPDEPDQRLVVWTVQPASPTDRKLAALRDQSR